MTTLSTWCFDRLDGAMRAEQELAALSQLGRLSVEDACLVFWPRTAQAPQMRAAGNVVQGRPLGSSFWGLLHGLTFAAPLLGCADSGPRCLAEVGVDTELIERLRANLRRGSSALLTVTGRPVPPELVARLGGGRSAGPAVQRQLSPRHEENLHRVFGS